MQNWKSCCLPSAHVHGSVLQVSRDNQYAESNNCYSESTSHLYRSMCPKDRLCGAVGGPSTPNVVGVAEFHIYV